ncbi:GNAT family N-acetyltransferase [Streptomyces sp. NPDC051644]|uniref:GNAT family N-acetyltransferase n=1 Tax=Streptomyces sp. NPDC051644 TaxID=3365666 RepID=UPI00378D7245
MNPARTSAALSYILREDVWGHGYATKAVALVLDFASTTLGLASVCAKVNDAAAKAAHRPLALASRPSEVDQADTCRGDHLEVRLHDHP